MMKLGGEPEVSGIPAGRGAPDILRNRLVSGILSRFKYRGVAQLVARTAGGREVAGSSPVTPTNV
jgi:hypothetical protein